MTARSKKCLAIGLIWLLALPSSIFASCHDDPTPMNSDSSTIQHASMQMLANNGAATDPAHHPDMTSCSDSHPECDCMHMTGLADADPSIGIKSLFNDYLIPAMAALDFTPELIKPPPRPAS